MVRNGLGGSILAGPQRIVPVVRRPSEPLQRRPRKRAVLQVPQVSSFWLPLTVHVAGLLDDDCCGRLVVAVTCRPRSLAACHYPGGESWRLAEKG